MTRHHIALLLFPALALAFALLVWPLCVLGYSSMHRGGTFTAAMYGEIFTNAAYRTALLHSLLLSTSVAAGATLLCLGPAWFLAQHSFPGRSLIRLVFALPMSLSGIMVGFFAIIMLGRVGFVPQTLNRWTGTSYLAGTAYQLSGLVVAYLYFEIPRGVLSLEAALRKFDPALLDAAASLGAGSWQRLRWVILPLATPALLNTFALTFSVSLGSFGVALILSRRFSVLPLELFHEFTALSNAPQACAMAVMLAAIAWTTQQLVHRLTREVGGMKTCRNSLATSWTLGLLTLAMVVIVLSPFAVVLAGAALNTQFLGLSTEAWSGDADGQWFTLHWLGYVWDLYHDSFFFSLKLAILSTLCCLALGVPAAWGLVRWKSRLSLWLESLLLLPLALPGIALSLAIIQAYAVVRGSWWLILGGHLLYTLPFMVRIVLNALRSFNHQTLDDCARGLGAGFWQRFRLVLLPNLRHAMMTGSLMAFAVSWGEFNVSYLLNTPLNQTYPAALYATYTSNSFQVGSAATAIFLAVIIPALLVIQRLGGAHVTKAA